MFDLETDGLLPKVSKVHCCVIRDLDDPSEALSFRPHQIRDALKMLWGADEIWGHNIIGYDLPVIYKLYPEIGEYQGTVRDTLVLSRLCRANLVEEDANRGWTSDKFPKRLWGSHALKAWGLRLGNHKGDYDGGWAEFSEEMLDYCVQDTSVTVSLAKEFSKAGFSEQCIELEHQLAEICLRIGSNGWTFDMEKATALYAKLAQRRGDLEDELNDLFPPWTIETDFMPKVNNSKLGYVKGETFVKSKTVHFNPASRQHIEKCLKDKYRWKPTKFTPSGQAQIDETILGKLSYPEAQKLAEFFMLQKRIGQLAEGSAAWLKKVDTDGRLRHQMISGGTVSGRASCRSPNLQQVPRASAPYGRECRELFTAPKDWWITGSDLSGVELRLLAHYLDDGGEYARQILEGDIHTFNMKAAGLATRDQAKTWVYATLYGAGDSLIGKIAGGGAKRGKKLKQDYDKAVPAFAELKKKLKAAQGRGYLKGLDGRRLFVRSEHRLLSQLLQSAGAVVAKKWVQLVDQEINQKHGPDQAFIMGWIHDEIQVACRTKEIAEDVGDIAGRMAQETGVTLKVKIPIAAEYSVGRTWADTH